MLMTREQLLQQTLPTEVIDVPWIEGGQVCVRAVPVHIQSRAMEMKEQNADAFVFIHCVLDDKGARLYTDKDLDIVSATVDTALLQLVAGTAYRLSLLDETKQEAIKKNWLSLDTDHSGESPSA